MQQDTHHTYLSSRELCHVGVQHEGTRFADWPKRFEWVTWRYFPPHDRKTQTPPPGRSPGTVITPTATQPSPDEVQTVLATGMRHPPSAKGSSTHTPPYQTSVVNLTSRKAARASKVARSRPTPYSTLKPTPNPPPKRSIESIDLTLSPGSSFDDPIVL
ncbi:hypothetical protein L227DRAFT_618055 [Lentinus tigrinus ALCF2SS1-6]|uniref:Uncharacterized protein n=1 Tax=Lentinus tigrinus ALCF2SS1-6 TaxID=1328759 RepID=A0A5C2RLE5_9APHY|nr:hypothetical protein L227DRAFT_618055 [Lentinus tigrinus ALCF2SS1-6]